MNHEILHRSIAEIQVQKDLEKKLKSNKTLRVKFGIDPTGYDLTLGHAVPLRKLKAFQDLGHHIILLFGNFTAQIGDPTGKSKIREPLTKAQVEKNAQDYISQAGKILDMSQVEIVYNADWLEKISYKELLTLKQSFTVAQMLQRDMFKERIKNNQEISLVEFEYPLMQGYDSVHLKSDIEIGGSDQLFNMMCARPLQKAFGQRPQDVLTVKLLEGLDGKEKMSKSLNNYIALNDSPKEMFGKTMSLPDTLILKYFELATDVPMTEIQSIQKQLESGETPRDIKIRLAKEIIKLYHNTNKADLAEKEFLEVFQNKGMPDEIPEIHITKAEMQLWDLINTTKLCTNSSESKRMIDQGSIKINGEKFINKQEIISIRNNMTIQIGKRKWIKVRT